MAGASPRSDDSGMHVVPDGPAAGSDRAGGGAHGPRRRVARSATGALVAILLVGALILVRNANDRTPAAPSPSASVATPAPAAPLPHLATGLPERLTVDLGAAPLSTSPARRARALAQPGALDAPGENPPILLLTDDNNWRRVDVGDLRTTTDAGGNPQPALDRTSLSPDGTRAAFAQRDHVTVVEVTSGTAYEIAVPGFNENVTWLGNRLLVSQDALTYLVGPDRKRSVVPYRGSDAVVAAGDDGDVAELTIARGAVRLRRWHGATPAADRVLTGIDNVASWLGPGWRRGPFIARGAVVASGTAQRPTGPPVPRVVLVDTTRGTARTLAALDGGSPTSLAVLGWHDAQTVLISATGPGQRILAYDIRSGAVAYVAEVSGPAAVLCLADGGR